MIGKEQLRTRWTLGPRLKRELTRAGPQKSAKDVSVRYAWWDGHEALSARPRETRMVARSA